MTELRNYDSAQEVADAAAENAVDILRLAIEQKGKASWVLAGGTSPMAAYEVIVKQYADAIDWSLITIIIGDERLVPLADHDSNWGTIIKLFDKDPLVARVQRIVPDTSLSPELAAHHYEQAIKDAGILRFDLMWVGVGEDGHTLSLFPGHDSFADTTERLVIPVYDSPKLPAERISLSLRAFEHIVELVIFAVGASKYEVLKKARLKGGVPVSIAAEIAEAHGAEVRWLYDAAAWGE